MFLARNTQSRSLTIEIYTVDFDTGSSDLFLPSSACGSNCSGHNLYDPGASSTSQDLGQTFKIGFEDGSSVTGEQYTDDVQIAGLEVCINILSVFPSLYADVPYQGQWADPGSRNGVLSGL